MKIAVDALTACVATERDASSAQPPSPSARTKPFHSSRHRPRLCIQRGLRLPQARPESVRNAAEDEADEHNGGTTKVHRRKGLPMQQDIARETQWNREREAKGSNEGRGELQGLRPEYIAEVGSDRRIQRQETKSANTWPVEWLHTCGVQN